MDDPNRLHKIVFISGKGGVGKSTVAAAVAYKQSQLGRRVLLVELGEQSYYERFFGLPIGFKPTSVYPNMEVALWDGENCLREFILYYVKIRRVVDLFFNNAIMKTFINAAPALKELAVLGKITSHPRQVGPPLEYDTIVVDAPATGHFQALLRVPYGMSQAVRFGPMGEQCRSIAQVISDPSLTQMGIVTLAEDLPITETLELYEDLKTNFGHSAEVFVNKTLPLNQTKEELVAIQKKLAPESAGTLQADFLTYLLNSMDRVQSAGRQLSGHGISAHNLPLVLSEDPQTLCDTLSKNIGELWKP